MADAGHKATDKLLKKLEKDIAAEYKIAVNDMEAKLTAYLEKTEAQRKVQEGMLNAGEITQKEYSNWCYRHNMVGERWEQMRDTLAHDMTHANEIAKGIMEQRMPDVFALNANYATWQIESQGIDTGFTLYNHDTAAYLLGDQRQLMPKPSPRKAALIAANPDMQWNKQKIQSAVLQGVLQGESASEVAQRLRQVGQMNYNSAVRYARTMTTSAQNAGRYEAFHRAKRLGVDLTIEWEAILDHHTRHSHRNMHGQRHEVDEPFIIIDGSKQYTIYYPADCTGASTAPQKEIWNCRCTLLSWVKGYEGDTVKESPALKDMSFEEWQDGKKEKEIPIPAAPADIAAGTPKQSYFRPLSEQFRSAGFDQEDIDVVDERFKQLDEVYHARVTDVVSTLERDQREYDIQYENYVNKLLNDNPSMRRSTAQRKALDLMGERPTKADPMKGGDYNVMTGELTLNPMGLSNGARLDRDIRHRTRIDQSNARRLADGKATIPRGNVGISTEATFLHEYGHAIDKTYGVGENQRFLEFYNGLSRSDIVNGLSEYAATNKDEFIAECFLDSFMGETQGKISKEFMKILGEIVG